MRSPNSNKGQGATSIFKLCVFITVVCILAMAALAMNMGCLTVFTIFPTTWTAPDPVTQCVPFTYDPPFSTAGPICAGDHPAGFVFYWPGTGIPAWVQVNPVSGVMSGCADITVAPGPYTFQVGATGFNIDCWPSPITADSTSTVTLNVIANPAAPLSIDPVLYPSAWENMPFSMTLSATGCSGSYSWSAAGLPPGLTVTDNVSGVISGAPLPGTCGVYTVTVTCSDTGFCPTSACCPPVSRPFILFVDCFGLMPGPYPYPAGSCDFTVQIGPGLTQGQASVIVDGTLRTTLAGGGSDTFTSIPCQSHTVQVSDTVQGFDVNTRFKVTSQNPQTVDYTNNTARFDYAPEVSINTASSPAGVTQPPNSGFYAVGSTFISTAPSPVIPDGQQGTKYIFRDWKLPDNSISAGRDLMFTVNAGGTVTSEYDTYYLLTLQSQYPYVLETQWEPKDSTATYDLALQPIPMQGFWGLLGGVMRPINASGTQLMTAPYTQVIEWSYDFTIPIIIISVILLLIIGLVVFLIIRSKRTKQPVTQP